MHSFKAMLSVSSWGEDMFMLPCGSRFYKVIMYIWCITIACLALAYFVPILFKASSAMATPSSYPNPCARDFAST